MGLGCGKEAGVGRLPSSFALGTAPCYSVLNGPKSIDGVRKVRQGP